VIAAASHKVGDPLAFYSVAATVIPLLFITLVFEAKALAPDEDAPERWTELATAVGIVAFALGGEVAALKVLLTQHPSAAAQSTIVGSLLLTSFGVLFRPLAALIRPMVREDKRPWKAILLVLGAMAVLVSGGLWGGSR
jgi:arginine exporter protein ArgO